MIDERLLVLYPPPVCRVIARRTVVDGNKRKVVPISSEEIAESSGLPHKRVLWISVQPTWNAVRLGDAVAFMKACQITNRNVWRQRWFLARSIGRQNGLSHLDQLPKVDRQRVSRIFAKNLPQWQESIRSFYGK